MNGIFFSRFVTLMALISTLIIIGTCGFVLIEGWPLVDALYMTIITRSTVGYGETQELTQDGRVFTAVLIVICMICMTCWTAGITSIFVSGELTGEFQKQKELKMISSMSGHTIVCGGGIMARTVIDQLVRQEKGVVAIVEDEKEIQVLKRLYPDLPIIQGDPKSELALADANAISAGYLVAAVESDFDNLLITITGRGLGTDIKVLSSAQSTELSSRMLKVGADQVICPLVLGGQHVASLIES